MSNKNIGLFAHLLRRAGFGATWDELEGLASKGYEVAVEELLAVENPAAISDDMVRRYHHEQSGMMGNNAPSSYWLYRMATTSAPLQEKMALFWHSVFATGYTGKVVYGKVLMDQIRMFRRYGLGGFKTLLIELSRDPAMIAWLDNLDNHNGAINENYGRELLELFSMGVGNYTEEDIKECARAFTGWTIGNADYMSLRARRDSIWPYGRIAWHFEYRPEDHDDGEKTFLGRTGRFKRRGRRRHHLSTRGHRQVHFETPLPLLRGRRTACTPMALHSSARPGCYRLPVRNVLRQQIRHGPRCFVRSSTPISSSLPTPGTRR